MNQTINHCCEWMDLFIKDPQVAIVYWPMYRMYAIPYLEKGKLIHCVRKGLAIVFCPWCAKELPKTLYNEWLEILINEFNLYDPLSKKQISLIPQEFKTDEWWKKRSY